MTRSKLRADVNIQRVIFTVSSSCHFGRWKDRSLRHGKHFGRTLTTKCGEHQIWFSSKQKCSEFSDTFFHEMVHLFLGMYGYRGGLSVEDEECLAQWIGYHAKVFLGNYISALRRPRGRKETRG